MMLEQFHLTGKRHSGRGVRVKGLDDVAVADNLTSAAKIVGPDAIFAQLKKEEWRIGLKQFIVEISDPCEDPFDPKVKWKKVTPMDFDEGLGKYFTSKDIQVLEAIYRDFHEVTKDELDAIVGKGKPVSEG